MSMSLFHNGDTARPNVVLFMHRMRTPTDIRAVDKRGYKWGKKWAKAVEKLPMIYGDPATPAFA
jgi:hypothetical protein